MARKTPEGKFNEHLDAELDRRFPGCEILKLDPMVNYQGIPDKIVLFEGRFGVLETKAGMKSKYEPNQEYHIERLKGVGFSASINPDNCEEVLDAMAATLRPEG